ncbi:NAD(P)/FAD-dependent oxidoreductase [Herbiconiux sp. L3-i23]|uniref:dihydrolipoyl dehydrogenase family protein n=1 Tax=Herbiconiux sp. L3-i23 TaxID=2905871 RepID=UPI0020741436|nr:NAD(P)/FAD-dependent oxidoreductase [Herbiconiux sp. L3-i23]
MTDARGAESVTKTYDLIVIGAGPVGENVADYATKRGLSTVIVESELVGGECSYWACTPSKAILRPVLARDSALRVEGAKESITAPIDSAAVLRRRDSFVHDWSDQGQVDWLDSAGIDLVRGHGRITGVKKVTVTAPDGSEIELEARAAVTIATGSAALLPDIPGLLDVDPWTSREATGAKEVPASLAIIGGGVVAAEMATAYTGLGSEVTLIVRGTLLEKMEPFAGELVAEQLEKSGATLKSGSSPTSARRGDDGLVVLEFDDGSTVTAAEVLVATGRTPRTEDLGLGSIGLTNGDWLQVDDTLLVTAPTNDDEKWLYATGDVNHRALLTHQGKYQARAAGEVIAARAQGRPVDDAPWGLHVATADAEAVPQVTFTDPEVASIGHTEKTATDAGYPVRVVDYDIGSVAGAALQADGYAGKARLIVDTDRDVILGATFVGQDVADLLHSATIAVVGEVPLRRLWHAVPSYPTISEIWLRLLETYGRPES